MFFRGPHTRLLNVCHVVAFQPCYFQMLLDHVSINVNVFWVVKTHVKNRG